VKIGHRVLAINKLLDVTCNGTEIETEIELASPEEQREYDIDEIKGLDDILRKLEGKSDEEFLERVLSNAEKLKLLVSDPMLSSLLGYLDDTTRLYQDLDRVCRG